MGKALEWLGAAGCERVALTLLSGPTTQGVPAGKIGAHCPFHQESSPGGAFFYAAAEDVGHCYSCGQTSDLLGIFCALQGKGFEDADCFREFRSRYAPEHAGDGRPVERSKPRPQPVPRPYVPRQLDEPPALWMEKAGMFVDHACARLLETPEALEQLAAWGLDLATVEVCRIGWNEKDKFPPVTAWGFPHRLNGKGKEARLFLPEGLVIPFAPGGRVVHVKIRRADPEADPRYWKVKGGAERCYVYGRPDWGIWVVIETERDAAMVWSRSRILHVGAMGLGSASKRPDAFSLEILRRANLILVALDNDKAGATHSGWWLSEFPQAVRWPVPPDSGKDPGEAVGKDLDILAWVRSGVPSHLLGFLESARGEVRTPRPEAQPEPVRDVGQPPGVAVLLGRLRRCSRAYAAANSQDGIGVFGCQGCPHNPFSCEIVLQAGALLFEDKAVADYVAAQTDGRLRG